MLVGCLWIYTSDTILDWLVHDQQILVKIAIYKGSFYVIFTSLLLYFLINRYSRSLADSEQALKDQVKSLLESKTNLKQAEAALLNIRRLHEATERIGKVGGWEFDTETLEQTWTDEVYRIHEVELSYKPTIDDWINFYTPESRSAIEHAVQHAIEHGEPFDVELEIITAKRNTKTVHAIGRADREKHKVSGFIQDITDRKIAEESLKLTRFSIDHSSDGLFWMTPDARIIDVNEAACCSLGYSREELLQLSIPDIDPFYDADVWRQFFAELQQKGTLTFETEHLTKDSKRFPVEIVSNLIQFGSKKLICAFVRNITDRKMAEQALQYERDLSMDIINAQPAGIYRIRVFAPETWKNDAWRGSKNSPHVVELASETFFKILGTTKEAFENNPGVIIDLIYPDDREGFAKKNEEAAVLLEEFNWEGRLLIDGAIRWVRFQSLPRPLENGDVLWTGALLDITDRKKAEDRIHESENRLRYALEGSNDGLWDVQLKTGNTYLSPRGCAILGYRENELEDIIKVWSDMVHPDDLQITKEQLQAHMDGNAEIFAVEQRLRTKSGDWKWIHTRGKIVEKDLNGVPIRITGTHTDIHDKKLLESQLFQAQKMESIGSLAGGVAHDFNNKLSVILGCTYLAQSEEDSNKRQHFLEEIQKAAEQSADLTRQLLAFARKQTISPKLLDLNDTISGMIKMLQRLIGENIHLAWLPAPSLWQIMADPSQIDQILANLCVNAKDAIRNVGRITIETRNKIIDNDYCVNNPEAIPGEYVHLSVSDNGSGMDKETISQVFEPFFTTKGLGEGTGLGLATVYGIVKQNNGFINIYSEPGQGTTFTIHLPRYVGKSVQNKKEGMAIHAPVGSETILLVEDELAILNMVSMILSKQGYTVLSANTPAEAISMAKESSSEINLLITDVIMPETNGKELSNKLQSLYPQLKCLYMSGYTADAITQHGVLDEGVNFIQKPFSLPALATKVREVLDKKS
ncbi:PAS domain S-box protein [Pelobacter propionicus]|uniref:PAS domain S-box protein n=1 Tax=Pelobacter propionicus TaxID=29543 RepID=UPI0018DB88E4|nr:PAS domain S-box protein [Pelobacter propionicus]